MLPLFKIRRSRICYNEPNDPRITFKMAVGIPPSGRAQGKIVRACLCGNWATTAMQCEFARGQDDERSASQYQRPTILRGVKMTSFTPENDVFSTTAFESRLYLVSKTNLFTTKGTTRSQRLCMSMRGSSGETPSLVCTISDNEQWRSVANESRKVHHLMGTDHCTLRGYPKQEYEQQH